jgi:hypothetical protein
LNEVFIIMELNQTIINGIVKYINTMYSPIKIDVNNIGSTYWIDIYFKEDEDFVPSYHRPVNVKSINLQNKIKKNLIGFFNVSSFLYNNDLNIEVKFV